MFTLIMNSSSNKKLARTMKEILPRSLATRKLSVRPSVYLSVRPSVCLSVCLSVKRMIVTKRKKRVPTFYHY